MPFQSTRRDVAAARPIREDVNDGLRDKVLFWLLHAGSLPAFGFRLDVVTLGVIVLWRLRSHRAVLLAAAMLAAVFAVIVSDEPGGSGA